MQNIMQQRNFFPYSFRLPQQHQSESYFSPSLLPKFLHVSSCPSATKLSQVILIHEIICFRGIQMIIDRFVDSKELSVHRDEDYFNVNSHLDAKEVHVQAILL